MRRLATLILVMVPVLSARAAEQGPDFKPVQPNLIRNGDFAPGLDRVAPRDWMIDPPFKSSQHAEIVFFEKGMTVRPSGLGDNRLFQYAWGDENPAYRLRCRAKQEGGDSGAEATIQLRPIAPPAVTIGYMRGQLRAPKNSAFRCPADGQWHDVELNVDGGAHSGFQVQINVPGKSGSFSIASLTVEGVFPTPENDAVVRFDDAAKTALKGIAISAAADELERKGAAALRLWIYRISGQVVPILAMETAGEQSFFNGVARTLGLSETRAPRPCPPGYLYLGKAAVAAGVVAEADLATIGRDGYAIASNGGIAGIAGRQSGGTLSGVSRFGQILGITHFAPMVTEIKRRNPLVIPELKEHRSPAFDLATVESEYLGYCGDDDGWEYGFLPLAATMGDPENAAPANGGFSGWAHAAPFLAPPYLYNDSHPEFYAMDKNGKRSTIKEVSHFSTLHLCLSDPVLQDIAAKRIEKLIESQPNAEYYSITQADGPDFFWCQCPKCRALDANSPGRTDRLMTFANHVAEKVGKKYPDKKLLILAYYLLTSELPLRVKPANNVTVMFCYWLDSSPIWEDSAHPLNGKALKLLAAWNRLMPGRLLTCIYPVNVYETADKIRYCAAHGVKGFALCGLRGAFPEIMCRVVGRLVWEPDADVETLIDEIMPAMYGKEAAPFMRQYFDAFHDFIRRITGPSAGEAYRTYFDYNLHRVKNVPAPYFNSNYALLTNAENAAQNNPPSLTLIRREKCLLLFAEINSRNPLTTPMDDAALASFAARLAELVELTSAAPHILPVAFHQVPFTEWLRHVTLGKLEFVGTPYTWPSDPNVKTFLATPLARLKKEKPIQNARPGGWELPAKAFYGGEYIGNYGGRAVNIARREGSGKSRIQAFLYLDAAPDGSRELRLYGMDNDKLEKARIAIKINERTLYSGPIGFEKRAWSEMVFKIPAGTLKKGENSLAVENVTPEAAKSVDVADRPSGDMAVFAVDMLNPLQNYRWGWFILEKATIVDVKP